MNLRARAGVKIKIDRLKSGAVPFGGGLSSLTSKTDWMVTDQVSINVAPTIGKNSRFRPLLPSKAEPDVGCLLLHITALS